MTSGRNRAQVMIEYGVCIALFIAALVGMQIYLKRSFQGYIKRNTDTISAGEQFSSALSDYAQISKSSSMTLERITPQGKITLELLEPETSITKPFVDDFSDKKLTEEGLFE